MGKEHGTVPYKDAHNLSLLFHRPAGKLYRYLHRVQACGIVSHSNGTHTEVSSHRARHSEHQRASIADSSGSFFHTCSSFPSRKGTSDKLRRHRGSYEQLEDAH